MGSSDLLVCLFASSFLLFSDLLFWTGIHGKEAGFIKDGGRECTEHHSFERKAGEKSEVLLRKVVCISGVERRALVNQIPISSRSTSSEQTCISFRYLTALYGAK